MSEWGTYRLRSFLLFSPRTYDRLIEDYNAQLWPLQAVLVAVAVTGLVVLARQPSPARDRAVFAALAAAWCTVAWLFEHQRFAAINWAADYAALLFAAQALVLAWAALRGGVVLRVASLCGWLALVLAAIGMVAYPPLTAAFGRSWARAEVFALMPAPTALATLGCLLLASPVRKRLLVVPLLVCGLEGALLWGLYARPG